MEIQLVIKAPNQNIDDQVVMCSLDWTVKRLKNHLSEVYPNKPIVQEQKLIYSGRLLHDHLHLKDILRHEDEQSPVHILHLVCNGKNNFQSYSQVPHSSQEVTNRATQRSQTVNTNSADTVSRATEENELRHRTVLSAPQLNNPFPPLLQPGTVQPVAFPQLPSDPQFVAQMAAMQQMYAYYMAQYMQSTNPGLFSSNPTFPNAPSFQPQQINPGYIPDDTPAQRPENQRVNAHGAHVEENEDMGNRDWLDHLFVCCRYLILFSIIYFYSTPERLMIVVVFAIIAFLYHEGWFVRRPTPAVQVEIQIGQRNRPNVDANANAENQANDHSEPNQNLAANEEMQDAHELEAAMDGDEPPHVQNPDVANNNQIFSPLTFLAAFFSSLIPEPPPPVNIN